MTDEELQQIIQDISESIEKLSDPEKTLTKDEERRKQLFLLKKEVLLKIVEAREKKDRNKELAAHMDYTLLTTFGEKHPFLFNIMRSKIRMGLLY